jgi:hypothetical protein
MVSMRMSLVMLIVASACTDPVATSDDGDHIDDVPLQCSSPVPCPAPSSSWKQTICGQLHDFETDASLGGSVGTACTSPTSAGPCSLAIEAYDALAFAQNPGAAAPLPHGGVEIDTCGRYRITDIDVTGISAFIGVAIDDVASPGPAGTTVPVAVVTPRVAGTATDSLEAWIVRESTTAQWTSSGGPALADGVFVPVFRAHMLGTPGSDPRELQPGVTATKQGSPAQAYYFAADTMERVTVDAAAEATGANGTVLVPGAVIEDLLVYSGTGGLGDPASCRWGTYLGASIPGVVFIQIFRPIGVIGETCTL